MIRDRQTDGQTDIRTDRRPGKNNMSPNPSGGDINICKIPLSESRKHTLDFVSRFLSLCLVSIEAEWLFSFGNFHMI